MTDTVIATGFPSPPRRSDMHAKPPLFDLFDQTTKRVDLRSIVMNLTSVAYHGLEDKGTKMLSDHINDVRDAVADLYRDKVSREEFDYLRLLTEAHEVGEIKDKNGDVVWTRQKLMAYRHQKQPLPQSMTERILKLAKKSGQPYLNYIWDLGDDLPSIRTKRADLYVNRSPDREKLNPDETSDTFKAKKAFLYQCADEYLEAVENGEISRSLVTPHAFILNTPHLAALLPSGADSLKPFWQSDYTPPAEPTAFARALKRLDNLANGAVKVLSL